MTTNDKEFRAQILNDVLIHKEECEYSLYDKPCTCWQQQVADSIMQLHEAECRRREVEARKSQTQKIRDLVGWEEEPDFDPGDATYGDSEHDHNAVIYGRNEAKGEIQGLIENELAELKATIRKEGAA